MLELFRDLLLQYGIQISLVVLALIGAIRNRTAALCFAFFAGMQFFYVIVRFGADGVDVPNDIEYPERVEWLLVAVYIVLARFFLRREDRRSFWPDRPDSPMDELISDSNREPS